MQVEHIIHQMPVYIELSFSWEDKFCVASPIKHQKHNYVQFVQQEHNMIKPIRAKNIYKYFLVSQNFWNNTSTCQHLQAMLVRR